MKSESYEQMSEETGNWLKAGRIRLLGALLRRHAGRRPGLRVLEIGAGVGQNVSVLRTFGSVDVLEINPLGVASLRALEGVRDVFDVPAGSDLGRTYDVVVAMDVLEHLGDDRDAARWVASLLEEGGVFVATVPAYQWLFSDHDRALEHHRRYTRARLLALLPDTLRVTTSGYFVSLLLPVVVALRLAGTVRRGRRRQHDAGAPASRKQSASVPGPLDVLLRSELAAEVGAISCGVRVPWGLSVFLVAEKVPTTPT